MAYAYWNNLISGNTDKLWGSTESVTIEHFLTYLLKVLEYDNEAKPIAKAEEIGLIPVGIFTNNSKLKGSDCADIMLNALSLNKKLEKITVAQSLVNYGVISDVTAAKHSLIPAPYKRIKVPTKVEGSKNLLSAKDVISAIPNAKFMDFCGIGSNVKIPFSYYLSFSYRGYKSVAKASTNANTYKHITEGSHNLNDYVGDGTGYGYTVASVYDVSYNIIATSIFDAKSSIQKGNVEFVLINFDTKRHLDYL